MPSVEKCPKCGSKLISVKNSITGKKYCRCSNEECHFILREDYTLEEIYLQGSILQTKCTSCGSPLEVTCGPNGLYARCYKCNIDLNPMTKWINSYQNSAKKEIVDLISNFKREMENGIGFDPSYEVSLDEIEIEPQSNDSRKISDDILETMLNPLRADLKKSFSPIEISSNTNIKLETVRNYLIYLRQSKEVKVVGYEDRRGAGPLTMLYQVAESPLPELDIKTFEDGYITVQKFLDENKNRLGSLLNSLIIHKILKNKEINFSPLMSSNGMVRGYSKEVLESIVSEYVQSNVVKAYEKIKLENIEKEKVKPVEKEETKPAKKESNTKEKIQAIINELKNNLNKGYSTPELTELLNCNPSFICAAIKNLRRLGKIKIVGCYSFTESKGGFCGYLFQLKESPLKEIKIKNNPDKYTTLKRFLKKYKKHPDPKLYKTAQELLEKNKVHSHYILLNNNLLNGYAIKDLEENLKDTLPKILGEDIESEEKINTEDMQNKSMGRLNNIITSWFKKEPPKDPSDIVLF